LQVARFGFGRALAKTVEHLSPFEREPDREQRDGERRDPEKRVECGCYSDREYEAGNLEDGRKMSQCPTLLLCVKVRDLRALLEDPDSDRHRDKRRDIDRACGA
jgi:hypothetical protein